MPSTITSWRTKVRPNSLPENLPPDLYRLPAHPWCTSSATASHSTICEPSSVGVVMKETMGGGELQASLPQRVAGLLAIDLGQDADGAEARKRNRTRIS
jgi:hypothetical protein